MSYLREMAEQLREMECRRNEVDCVLLHRAADALERAGKIEAAARELLDSLDKHATGAYKSQDELSELLCGEDERR